MSIKSKSSKSLVTALITLIAVIVLVSIVGIFVLKPPPMMWQGEVEATEVRVSGKIPGRISAFYAEEGQEVKKGDTLIIISSPEVEAKLKQASAVEQAALAQEIGRASCRERV